MPSLTPLSALKHTFLQNQAKNLGPKLNTRVFQQPVFLFKASMVMSVTYMEKASTMTLKQATKESLVLLGWLIFASLCKEILMKGTAESEDAPII